MIPVFPFQNITIFAVCSSEMFMAEIDFDIIYKSSYRKSFLFVKSYIHDDMASEDIAMESLYKYWKILRENRKEVSEKYLVSILKNSAISYLRRQSAHRNAMDAISESYRKDLELRLNSITSCDPEILFSDEIRKIYRKTMESLPAKTAMIFEMRKNDRLPVKQIARITGISEKTVEYHITKAIKALRSGLSEYLPAFIVFCIIMKIKSEL